MTFADLISRVATGLMSDPNFTMVAQLQTDVSVRDNYGNKTAEEYKQKDIVGFFDLTPEPKTIAPEGVEPHAIARFFTYDVTTTIKLQDRLLYDNVEYTITYVIPITLAGTTAYRILGLARSEVATGALII